MYEKIKMMKYRWSKNAFEEAVKARIIIYLPTLDGKFIPSNDWYSFARGLGSRYCFADDVMDVEDFQFGFVVAAVL